MNIKGYCFGKITETDKEDFAKITGGCEVGDYYILISKEEAEKNWEELKSIVFNK